MNRITHINRFLKGISCFLLIVLCTKGKAQIDSLIKAQELFKAKYFEEAIKIIDKVVKHPDTKNYAESWNFRSFAYLNYSKKVINQSNLDKVNLIDIGFLSAVESIKLDSTKDYFESNKQFIESAAKQYLYLGNQIIMNFLTEENYNRVEEFYNTYKRYMLVISPTMKFNDKDIEHYNVIGTHFGSLFVKDTTTNKQKNKYLEISKVCFLKILTIDSDNFNANRNLGVLYFNQGATIVRSMDYNDFELLYVIQEDAKKLFNQSLPHMKTAYKINPTSDDVLYALEGIYESLYLKDEANQIKQKRKELKNKH